MSNIPHDYEDEPDEDEEPKTAHMPMTRSGSQADESHCLRGRSGRVPMEAGLWSPRKSPTQPRATDTRVMRSPS